MKKIKIIIASLLLTVVCLTSINAQKSSTKYYFFDSNWKITTSKNYSYYRKVDVNAKGNYTNPIVDYYRNGEIQCIVKADFYTLNSGGTFLKSGGKNGETAFFDTAGKMVSYQRYANGRMVENKQIQSQNTESEWTTEDIIDGVGMALTAWEVYKFFKGK